MKITINGLDYTSALDAVRLLSIERKLNEPSMCRFWLTLPSGGALTVPARNQPLVVNGDSGMVFFTGYLAVSPMPEYAGLGLGGPVYRLALEAVSDEILLDTQLLPPSAGTTGATAGQLMTGLVTRTGSAAIGTVGLTLTTPVSHFVPEAGAKWSGLAGKVASQARAAYRATSGIVSLAHVGATVHSLNEADGSLQLESLTLTPTTERALANDVTVCGLEEPAAYVTEYLIGDGTQLAFPLSEAPYIGPSSSEKIIWELFQEAGIDLRLWGYAGREGYFSITSAGLTMNGGTGVDGQVALVWNDAVEAGGTLLLEVTGVILSPGSTGTIAGVYSGSAQSTDCAAGFAVTSAVGTGAVSIAPLVQGVVAGASYTLSAAYQYTFRLRLHCPEIERITQGYRVAGDAGLMQFGGGGIVATARLLMEVEQSIDGVTGTPYVLYDGTIGYVPASYLVVAASSVNLIGNIRSIFMKSLGSGWVVSTQTGGSPRTRRLGTLADSSECHIGKTNVGTGTLTFYNGYAPALGEIIAVSYRTSGRAVGRAVNSASQAALEAVGYPRTAVWTGSVTEPAPRSSLDCRNAATALVTAASSVSAAWSGSYKCWNVSLDKDVWPGDALSLTASYFPEPGGGDLAVQVVVRAVALEYLASQPELVKYSITFSNDWANDLSVKTSRSVPADTWLPAPVSPTYLPNLNGVTVMGFSSEAVSVAMNVTPPAGGGFEIRRKDFVFQPGQDPDLVMRSAVANFDIPRASEADRFYVRMYDDATPPNYSEFSAALFVNLPLSA